MTGHVHFRKVFLSIGALVGVSALMIFSMPASAQLSDYEQAVSDWQKDVREAEADVKARCVQVESDKAKLDDLKSKLDASKAALDKNGEDRITRVPKALWKVNNRLSQQFRSNQISSDTYNRSLEAAQRSADNIDKRLGEEWNDLREKRIAAFDDHRYFQRNYNAIMRAKNIAKGSLKELKENGPVNPINILGQPEPNPNPNPPRDPDDILDEFHAYLAALDSKLADNSPVYIDPVALANLKTISDELTFDIDQLPPELTKILTDFEAAYLLADNSSKKNSNSEGTISDDVWELIWPVCQADEMNQDECRRMSEDIKTRYGEDAVKYIALKVWNRLGEAEGLESKLGEVKSKGADDLFEDATYGVYREEQNPNTTSSSGADVSSDAISDGASVGSSGDDD